MKSSAYVSLVFPSIGVTPEARRQASYRTAKEFAETHDLGNPTRMRGDVYGFSVPVDADPQMFANASEAGARVIAEEADNKLRTDMKPQPVPGAKGAVGFSKLTPVKEGEWFDLTKKVNAFKFEMHGTDIVAEPKQGLLNPGRYYVLGITEARDGYVATLGKTDKGELIGSSKVGKFVYNVTSDALAECYSDDKDDGKDVSTVKKLGGGVVGKGAAKPVQQAKPVKKESKEERVTVDSAHSRGLRILELLQERQSAANPLATPAKKDEKKAPEAEKVDRSPGILLETTSAEKLANKAADDLPPLDANLSSQLDLLFAEGGGGGGVTISEAQAASIGKHQLAESLDDVDTIDPKEFAAGLKAETSDEETEQQNEEEEVDESFTDEDSVEGDETEEEAVGLFEDLQPGDATSGDALAGVLKQRGVMNVDAVMQNLRSNIPANSWFNLTGGSLQDAKRLQWLFNAGK